MSEMEEHKDDTHADLSAAFDQIEGKSIGTNEPTAEIGRPAKDTPEPVRPAVEKSTETTDEARETDAPGSTSDAEGAEAQATETPAPAKELKAPGHWKPGAREQWGKIPPVVQAEIARRERDMAVNLQRTAEARRFTEEVTGRLQRYGAFVPAGQSLPETIEKLAATGATLRIGSPHQKAASIASMINEYGIDIGMLGDLLAGETPKPQDDVVRLIQEQMAPLQQYIQSLQGQQQQRRQQTQQEIASEVDQFAQTHEFFEDVKDEMGVLMATAAQRGRVMTLDQAYQRAIAVDDDLSKIVKQRNDAKAASDAAAAIANKRNASSSIRGTQGSGGTVVRSQKGPDDLRADLLAAMGER